LEDGNSSLIKIRVSLPYNVMKFSIIIITYNRQRSLERCISSLTSQDFDNKQFEIIIVDDGSNDNTINLIKRLQKKISNLKYYYQENKGYGRARNLGLSKAKGKIVAFTDDDCVVKKDWIKKISKSFDRFPKATVIGGSILNPNDTCLSWVAYILDFSYCFPFGRVRKKKTLPTANIAYKHSNIKRFQFAEGDSFGGEDTFFNYQLLKAGKIILFNPDIKVFHYYEFKTKKDLFNHLKNFGSSFVKRGYKIHGFIGLILVKLRFLNFLFPKLILEFFRCLMAGYLKKFIVFFPLLFRGELERTISILKFKK